MMIRLTTPDVIKMFGQYTCQGALQCCDVLNKSQLVLSKIQPITLQERRLYEGHVPDMNMAEFHKLQSKSRGAAGGGSNATVNAVVDQIGDNIVDLSWSTRIDLIVYNCLRNSIAACRYVNQSIPFDCLVSCMDICTDMLKMMSSAKYRSDLLSTNHKRSGSEQSSVKSNVLSSAAGNQFHEEELQELEALDQNDEKRNKFLQSRLVLLKSICGVMQECLYLFVTSRHYDHDESHLAVDKINMRFTDMQQHSNNVFKKYRALGTHITDVHDLIKKVREWLNQQQKTSTTFTSPRVRN
ncbi:hypothetical protein AKO1_008208 [Acrasis kona]|uniref:Uncharacterized protein n=1 Tax=Acrasis kona TaxID=1008807 RepID=A0AAW2YKD5_9EUKA